MKNEEFSQRLRQVNPKYKECFGYIPCITDFACSREEYLAAMERAIEEERDISEYLINTVYPDIGNGNM